MTDQPLNVFIPTNVTLFWREIREGTPAHKAKTFHGNYIIEWDTLENDWILYHRLRPIESYTSLRVAKEAAVTHWQQQISDAKQYDTTLEWTKQAGVATGLGSKEHLRGNKP